MASRSLSDSTSEQVRLILRAAEDGAAQLRAAAGTEASDHVTRVQSAADGMLTKLDALESELRQEDVALVLIEPLQGKGIILPEPEDPTPQGE